MTTKTANSKSASNGKANGEWPPEDDSLEDRPVPVSPLLDAIKRAGASDLDAIHARIEELEKELETLRFAEKIIDRRINGKEKRAPRGSGGAGKVDLDALADKVFDLITKEGPGKPADIALKLGVAPTSVGKAIAKQADWFVRDGYGKVSIAR